MLIDTRFEGRVYQCGRGLVELCAIGATCAICEFTDANFSSYMAEVSIAECEISILSGKWKPANHAQIVSLVAHGMASQAVAS